MTTDPLCHEALLRLPDPFETVTVTSFMVLIVALEVLFSLMTGGRIPPNYRRCGRMIAFQVALLFIRADVRIELLFLYVVWLITRNWPWKKWRQKVTNKLAGLTDVASASIHRQETEAMS